MNSHPPKCSWSEAKRTLAAALPGASNKDIRGWAERINNPESGETAIVSAERALGEIRKGDAGICRYRINNLHQELGDRAVISDYLNFGDIYLISAVSTSGRWIKVAGLNGRSGWMPREKHFALATTDFSRLRGAHKLEVLNFLVIAIHHG